jgi:hypothetical protein
LQGQLGGNSLRALPFIMLHEMSLPFCPSLRLERRKNAPVQRLIFPRGSFWNPNDLNSQFQGCTDDFVGGMSRILVHQEANRISIHYCGDPPVMEHHQWFRARSGCGVPYDIVVIVVTQLRMTTTGLSLRQQYQCPSGAIRGDGRKERDIRFGVPVLSAY